jgi:ribosome-binding ATPase YchF (GTP1/OBG family)
MDIEDELEQKSIERDTNIIEVEPEPVAEPVAEPVKKTKKARSPAQIAAFEKARLARLEKVRIRKESESVSLPLEKLEEPIKENKLVRQTSTVSKPVINTSNPREQVTQNHYYYYGVPPPTEHYTIPKKKKKTKKPVIPVSSSSEEEEEESEEEQSPPSPVQKPAIYEELQNYEIKPQRAPQKKQFKFAYA